MEIPMRCPGKLSEQQFAVTEDERITEHAVASEVRPLEKAKNVPDTVTSHNTDNGYDVTGRTVPSEDLESCDALDSQVKCNDMVIETDDCLKLHRREKTLIDLRDKLYLAPLTTIGNFLSGQASEWALLRRHSSEDLFGVQICGAYPSTVSRIVELIDQECSVDFIDINMGCPLDVVNKAAGSALLTKPMHIKAIIQAAS